MCFDFGKFALCLNHYARSLNLQKFCSEPWWHPFDPQTLIQALPLSRWVCIHCNPQSFNWKCLFKRMNRQNPHAFSPTLHLQLYHITSMSSSNPPMEPRNCTASECAHQMTSLSLQTRRCARSLRQKKWYIILIFSFFLLTYMCPLKETASSAAGPHKAKAGSQKENVSGSSKVCTCALGLNTFLHRVRPTVNPLSRLLTTRTIATLRRLFHPTQDIS